MSEPSATKSDPVKWIGVVLSVVALGFTYLNYTSQNHKWEALNEPRFILDPHPHFVVFEEFADASAAKARKWGYQPLLLFDVSSDSVFTGKINRISELVWCPQRGPCLQPAASTLKEAETNGRLLDKKSFVLKHHLRAFFQFRNAGALPAKDLVWRSDARWAASGEWTQVSQSDHAVIVDAGEPEDLEIEAMWPLGQPFPKEVQFRFHLDWDGEKEPWVKTVRYDFTNNTWGPT